MALVKDTTDQINVMEDYLFGHRLRLDVTGWKNPEDPDDETTAKSVYYAVVSKNTSADQKPWRLTIFAGEKSERYGRAAIHTGMGSQYEYLEWEIDEEIGESPFLELLDELGDLSAFHVSLSMTESKTIKDKAMLLIYQFSAKHQKTNNPFARTGITAKRLAENLDFFLSPGKADTKRAKALLKELIKDGLVLSCESERTRQAGSSKCVVYIPSAD